jgi:hypothetical protein
MIRVFRGCGRVFKAGGFVYVTDGEQPNPWSRLPADWEDGVDTVTRLQ